MMSKTYSVVLMSVIVASSSAHCTKLIQERVENFMNLAVLSTLNSKAPTTQKEKMAAAMCLRRFKQAYSENIASIGTPLGLHTAMALAEKVMQVLLNSPHSGGGGSSLSTFRDLLSPTKAINTVFVHAWHDSPDPVKDLYTVYSDVTAQRNFFEVTYLGPMDTIVNSVVKVVGGDRQYTEKELNHHAEVVKQHRVILDEFKNKYQTITITDSGAIVSISASSEVKQEAHDDMMKISTELGINPFISKAVCSRVSVNYEVTCGNIHQTLKHKPCGYMKIRTDKGEDEYSKIISDAFGKDRDTTGVWIEKHEHGLVHIIIVSTALNLSVLGGIATKHFGKRDREVYLPPTFHRIAFYDMIENVYPVNPDFSKIAIRRTPGLQTSVPNDFLPNALVSSGLFDLCEDEKFHGCEVFCVKSENLRSSIETDHTTLSSKLKKWYGSVVLMNKHLAPKFMYVFMSMRWDFLTMVRSHYLVNYRMTISDSPKEMQSNFGMSGAEMTLINNFYHAIREMGNDILITYVSFVVRAMTMGNTIIPMTNNGITAIASNPLEEMNIRKAYDVAVKAAIRGEVVPNNGVTAAAFASTCIKIGTGSINFTEPKSYRLLTRLPFRHFDSKDFSSDPFESSGLFTRKIVAPAVRHGGITIFAFL